MDYILTAGLAAFLGGAAVFIYMKYQVRFAFTLLLLIELQLTHCEEIERLMDRASDDSSDMSPTDEEIAQRFNNIYHICHSFNKNYDCYNNHGEWRKEVLEAAIELRRRHGQ
jgi:hypothetical protein